MFIIYGILKRRGWRKVINAYLYINVLTAEAYSQIETFFSGKWYLCFYVYSLFFYRWIEYNINVYLNSILFHYSILSRSDELIYI